jgi:integrase
VNEVAVRVVPAAVVNVSSVVISGPTELVSMTLSESAAIRFRAAVPDSTRRAYRGDLRRFLDWHLTREPGLAGIMPAADTPTSAIGEGHLALAFAAVTNRVGSNMAIVLTEYVNHLANLGRAPSTIDRAIAAILVAHDAAGMAKPNTKAARAVLTSYRRERAEAGESKVRKATPVTVPVLRSMVAALDLTTTTAGRRDQALLVLGFALGARRAELASLDIADIAVAPDGLLVTIRRSKSDRESKGREVAIVYGSNSHTCPVRVTLSWIAWLAEAGRTDGPLFVRLDRHGVLGRAASGRGSADGRLTGQAVAWIVNRAADRAGLDPAAVWSGHSLRRGFATATFEAGADPLRVARHGGWKDGSAALLGYVEDVERWQKNPLVGVGL